MSPRDNKDVECSGCSDDGKGRGACMVYKREKKKWQTGRMQSKRYR